MATWVAHFRIAEALLKQFDLDTQSFLVGNIAPDSGVLADDNLSYIPSSHVSHWRNEGDIQPERFYAECLEGRSFDTAEYSFRLGYYAHLVADQIWAESIWRPKKLTPLYAEPMAKDPQFVWEIKKDWYGLDFLYLKENPQSIFHTDFVHIQDVPDYIADLFPTGAFTKRIQDTKTFYLNPPDWDLDRPYIYLNRGEWNDYIVQAIMVTRDALIGKGVSRL
jgi:hypothetical protein